MQIVAFGEEHHDWTNTPGWNLNSGSGDRHFDKPVLFQTPLTSVPYVLVSLALIDSDRNHNQRVLVQAKYVTNSGFTFRVGAWADTIVYGVWANWIALIP